MSIKTYIQIGVILAVIGTITFFINTRVIVKKSTINRYVKAAKKDSIKIGDLSQTLQVNLDTIRLKDSMIVFQSDRIKGGQQLLKDIKVLLSRAEQEAKTTKEELLHYEENGLMRYFVKRNKLFGKDCYEEVFTKPDCIK